MKTSWKRTGRLAGLLLCLALLVSLSSSARADGPALVIDSPEALNAFAQNVNSGVTYAGQTVVLAADIDMTGRTFIAIGWDNGEDLSHVFQGVFDGGGHTIRGLNITPNGRTTASGFFAATHNATVRDLSLELTIYTGGLHAAGGVAGRMSNGTLENVRVRGSISAAGWGTPDEALVTGGLVGEATGVTVMDRCGVQGFVYAGGNSGGNIFAGGVAGVIQGSPDGRGSITNCYSTASVWVTGDGACVGGFAGALDGAASEGACPPDVRNCYAAGSIDANSANAGAFAGRWDGSSASNVYYDQDLAAGLPGAGGGGSGPAMTGVPTEQLKDAAFPDSLGGAFYPADSPDNNLGYPILDPPAERSPFRQQNRSPAPPRNRFPLRSRRRNPRQSLLPPRSPHLNPQWNLFPLQNRHLNLRRNLLPPRSRCPP